MNEPSWTEVCGLKRRFREVITSDEKSTFQRGEKKNLTCFLLQSYTSTIWSERLTCLFALTQLNHPFGWSIFSSSSYSPSRLCRKVSRIPLTPSTSPILTLPILQSTTIGHLIASGFFSASSAIPWAVVGWSKVDGPDGWAERNTMEGFVAFEGR